MFGKYSQSSNAILSTSRSSASSVLTEPFTDKLGEHGSYEIEGESFHIEDTIAKDTEIKKCISVGDSLPYGPRLSYETGDNIVRMKDIGEKNRILLIGVIGSFTPDCWNRHLYRVLKKIRYYEEREVDYICCISTNDAFTQKAWAGYIGCEESVLMWADATKRFTKALGMDIVIPWLDNTIRSRRYVILAEDMVVTKMIAAPCDTPNMKWQCEHLAEQEIDEEDSDESWI